MNFNYNYTGAMKWQKIIGGGLIGDGIISAVLTYQGIVENGLGSAGSGWYLPPLLTVLSAGWALLVWYFCFEYFPRSPAQQRRPLIIIMMVSSSVIFMTSTYYAAIGLGGERAITHHLMVSMEQGEETFYKLVRRRQREEGVIGTLQQVASLFSEHERNEVGGGFSKVLGKGPVAAQIAGIHNGYQNLITAVENQQAQTVSMRDQGNRLLYEMHTFANESSLSAKEKSARAARQFQQINTLFLLLDTSVLPDVERMVEKIDTLYLVDLSNEVRQKLQKSVTESKALISRRLAEIGREEISIHRFRILDAEEAVTHYIWYSRSAWALALTADLLLPLSLLIIATHIASRAGTRLPVPIGIRGDAGRPTAVPGVYAPPMMPGQPHKPTRDGADGIHKSPPGVV